MIYTNDANHGGPFRTVIEQNLKTAKNVTIAVGYFGLDILEKYHSQLIKIGKHGTVKILIGMVFHSGVGKKQLNILKSLDSALKKTNATNGIFITLKEYHGKVYVFDESIYLGSSNFSSSGIEDRWECTAEVIDEKVKTKVTKYISYLLANAVTKNLSQVDLQRKKVPETKESSLDKYVVDDYPKKNAIGSFKIKLRVDNQPSSSLNLFFDKGRKSPTSGLYAPRPWYEIEITTEKEDRENNLYPKSELKQEGKNSRIGYFNAFIEFRNRIYKIQMSVGSDYGKAIASASGSGGRETLGMIIKSKLSDKGLLKYGERITSQILEDYGKDFITLTKYDNENYRLDF